MAVAFISNGYDTTSTNPYTEFAWATAHPAIGVRYQVRNPLDWKVTPVAGLDRTVSINAGSGVGHGITDKTVENETIQLDTITSGSRWDLIVCRRDWTPTAGESKFVKINGGSTAVIPGGRLVGPGNIDDQPLALVQVTAGQTQPTNIIDLRTWAGDNGVLVGNDDLIRSFLNTTGTVLMIRGVLWVRNVGANDSPVWESYPLNRALNGGLHMGLTALKTGWTRPFTAGSSKPRVWSTDGVTAHMTGLLKFNAGGGEEMVTIPAPFAPTYSPSTLTYVGAVQASNGASNPAGGPTIHLGIENGVLKIVYQSGTLPVGSLVPVTGTWMITE